MSDLSRGAGLHPGAVHEKALVSVPAGSGTTVQLVRRYLHELNSGATPARVVAITFTRKAAAELVERLGRVLRSVASGERQDGDAALYRDFAPFAEEAGHALAALPNAPVCTVDSFVFDLVSEFLLDARYVAGGQSIWIDGPLRPARGSDSAFEAGARAALEETSLDGLSADARLLLDEDTLDRALASVSKLAELDDGDLWADGGRLPGNARLLAAKRAASEGVLADSGDGSADTLRSLLGGTDERLLAALAAANTKSDLALPVAQDVVAAAAKALGVPVTWEDFKSCFAKLPDWDAPACARRDAVREAAWALSRRARAYALRTMAQRGESTHRELLRVATDLCRRAKDAEPGSTLARLRERYDALLVDEVQDTSPDQIAFYNAMLEMHPGIRRFFVGDARQSIYRFRGADLHGWRALVESTPPGDKSELTVNYRSSIALVVAQQTLFANLAALGAQGVDDLDGVAPCPGAAADLLDHASVPEPVVVVASSEGPAWQAAPRSRLLRGRCGGGAPLAAPLDLSPRESGAHHPAR